MRTSRNRAGCCRQQRGAARKGSALLMVLWLSAALAAIGIVVLMVAVGRFRKTVG